MPCYPSSSNSALRAPFGIYFGWWVIASLFMCGMAVYGAGLYGFTLFVTPLTEEFGWSRASTAGLVSVFWLSAPLSLLGGALNNRFGAFRLICFGVLLEGISLVLLGFVSELWQMYVLRTLMGLGKVLVAITLPIIVAKWFARQFGLANALSYAGWHFGGLTVTPVAQWLILSLGWRNTCFVLGGFILIWGLLPVLSALRINGPSDLGVGVDGDAYSEGASEAQREEKPIMSDWGVLRDLFGSGVFLLVAVGTILSVLAYSGLLTHQAAIAHEAGISPVLVAQALGLTAGSAFVGALIAGWFIDRVSFIPVMIADLLLMFIGIVLIFLVTISALPFLLFASVLVFGVAMGGFDVILVSHLRQRFGDAVFPYAFGVCYFLMLSTLFVAPIFIGILYDANGSYTVGLGFMAISLLFAVSAFVMLPSNRDR